MSAALDVNDRGSRRVKRITSTTTTMGKPIVARECLRRAFATRRTDISSAFSSHATSGSGGGREGAHYANPVLHGLTDDPAMWEYSNNYLEWVGQCPGALVDRAFVSEYFDLPAAYERYVVEYLRERTLPQPLAEYLQALDD